MQLANQISNAISKLRGEGFDISEIIFDEKFHRFGPKKALWYIARQGISKAGFPWFSVSYNDWRTIHSGAKIISSQAPAKASAEVKKEISECHKKAKAEFELMQLEAAKQSAEEVEAILGSCRPANKSHSYLFKKQITFVDGIFEKEDGMLIVPMENELGQIVSAQQIIGDLKLFWAGTRTKSARFWINKPVDKTTTVFLTEGFATGATIFQCTGLPVCVAFSAHNILPVAESLQADGFSIIVAADNDHSTKQNAGLTSARLVEKNLGIKFVYPKKTDDFVGTDFNDLFIAKGKNECLLQLGQGEIKSEEGQKWTELKANGFFDLVPKLDSKGEPIYNSADEAVMREVENHDALAEYLIDTKGACSKMDYSYLYDTGFYREIETEQLKQLVDKLTLKKCKPRQVTEFTQAIIYKTQKDSDFFDQPKGMINLRAGTLDVKTRKLLPHDRSRFFTYVLPHDFDVTAKCPRWMEFLDFVFAGDEKLINLTAEIFGYILIGGAPWLHKAFILQGSGRNGKSTWLSVLQALIGKDNYSAVPIGDLSKPFSAVMSYGKLANIVGEFESKDAGSEVFKRAISGDDVIGAKKRKDEFAFPFWARIVFATNNIPNMRDSSDGLYERLCIIPFEKYIEPKDRDPKMTEKLIAEMPGILNWSLDGLERLNKRGRIEEIGKINEAVASYKRASDSVFDYFGEHFKPGDTEKQIQPRDVYHHYAAWCRESGRLPKNKVWFVRGVLDAMRRENYPVTYHTSSGIAVLTGRVKVDPSIEKYLRFPKTEAPLS